MRIFTVFPPKYWMTPRSHPKSSEFPDALETPYSQADFTGHRREFSAQSDAINDAFPPTSLPIDANKR
jgi:hypothetical protein